MNKFCLCIDYKDTWGAKKNSLGIKFELCSEATQIVHLFEEKERILRYMRSLSDIERFLDGALRFKAVKRRLEYGYFENYTEVEKICFMISKKYEA